MYYGGFFELETTALKKQGVKISNELFFNTGRTSLGVILDNVSPKRAFVPRFTCEVVYQPFIQRNIELIFYSIDSEFEINGEVSLIDTDVLLYTNYFGLKDTYIEALSSKYGDKLIVDDTHSFFSNGYKGSWSFNSLRKFFGVPDGSLLFPPEDVEIELPEFIPNIDYSILHLIGRYAGDMEPAYLAFKSNEQSLGISTAQVSRYTREYTSYIDFEKAEEQRFINFNALDNRLKSHNQIQFRVELRNAPFCYPFLNSTIIGFECFWDRNIFVPVLWPDVVNRVESNTIENYYTKNLYHLPIDHRYSLDDMNRIADLILEML